MAFFRPMGAGPGRGRGQGIDAPHACHLDVPAWRLDASDPATCCSSMDLRRQPVEDLLGHVGYLIFYLATGRGGVSRRRCWPILGSGVPVVGASGAIAGRDGGVSFDVSRGPASTFSILPGGHHPHRDGAGLGDAWPLVCVPAVQWRGRTGRSVRWRCRLLGPCRRASSPVLLFLLPSLERAAAAPHYWSRESRHCRHMRKRASRYATPRAQRRDTLRRWPYPVLRVV